MMNRRQLLWQTGGGLGGIALAHLLRQQRARADSAAPGVTGAPGTGVMQRQHDGLHHPPKVQRIVQLFMNGGVSQMDTFDPKPHLAEFDGRTFDPGDGQKVESVTGSPGFKVLKSPFKFSRHGGCGRWVSEVFSHMAGCVDDLAFLMSMVSKTNVHGPASYMQNTGFVEPGFPAMGAWVSYALGSVNQNLPTFVVLPDSAGLPYNNKGNFSSGFLPVSHQGMIVRADRPDPIAYLQPPDSAPYITPESEVDAHGLLRQLNARHMAERPGDSRLESRIASYELAAKMQLSAPQVLDLNSESRATLDMYGADVEPTRHFGRNCLIARRLLERGVRFVQVWNGPAGAKNNWDNHANIAQELPPRAAEVDRPAAALLKDLKQRGMLEDTLVIWTTEFGRMPFSQGSAGRDHNGGTFVSWIAGGGIKGGVAYGESDEWGWKSRVPTWCYDLHATVLHLMGIDHEKLAVRHNGIDRRLTDVHGHVIREILV